jgi:nicotinamide mononucleotide transporter
MDAVTTFLKGMVGSSPIEITAAMLGFANVYLLVKRSIWNYPFGIAMVTLYAWIFFDAKLYSDMLLQPFFLVVQALGWWWWLTKRDASGLVIVERMGLREVGIYAACAVIGVACVGTLMASYTDAAVPYWDATTTVLSVIAQILLARRKLENWVVWIVVDVLAIGIYLYKGLQPTAVLYAVFLVLAIVGFFTWRRAEQQPVTA